MLILVYLAGMRIRRMAQAGNQRFAIAMALLAFGGFSLATIPPVTAGTPQWSLALSLGLAGASMAVHYVRAAVAAAARAAQSEPSRAKDR